MLLILTGTIRPVSSCGNLSLKDEQERLSQYLESIRFFITSGAFQKIIFCENSNFGTSRLEDLYDEAQKHSVELEILSFQGDVEQTALHGKGYGEGEIMQYAFENSKLLLDERYFIKITGRMKIENISDIVSRLETEKTYFNIPNRTHREMYDTRFYAMPTKMFKKYFINHYDNVMDSAGKYLEIVYTKILKDEHIDIRNFPRYPRIVGVSGSTGALYVYTEWKCKIKDLLSLFGFYKVKEESSK